MTSIVSELQKWLRRNRPLLEEMGVFIDERFPGVGDPARKASLGFRFGYYLIVYTVWERTVFQTDLTVVNGRRNEAIVMKEASPKDPRVVHSDLDEVFRNLRDGKYDKMAGIPSKTVGKHDKKPRR